MFARFKESELLRSHEETSGINVETDQPRKCKVDDATVGWSRRFSLVKKLRAWPGPIRVAHCWDKSALGVLTNLLPAKAGSESSTRIAWLRDRS